MRPAEVAFTHQGLARVLHKIGPEAEARAAMEAAAEVFRAVGDKAKACDAESTLMIWASAHRP